MLKRLFLSAGLVVTLALTGCSTAASSSYPSKTLDFVVPAKPGGAWDLTARSMQKVLTDQKLVNQNITITNKPGGNAVIAWNYVKSQNSYHLVMNSALLITNKLLGRSQLTYKNFTPIAMLNADWETLAVPSNSPYKSAKDLMQKLKQDPSSVTIGVFGLGNNAHLAFVEAAKSYGVDVSKLKFEVFGSGAKIVNALLGHHLDAATIYLSEATTQYKSGDLKLLAIDSGANRVKGFSNVPTWKEQGMSVSIGPNWRGIMGPPNMTKEEIAYWDKALAKMTKSKSWLQIQKNNSWTPFYKDSQQSKQFLAKQTQQYTELLKAAGMTK